MAEEIKRYVDTDGLNLFLQRLKAEYAKNSDTRFVVKYSQEAGKVSHTLTIKDSEGIVLGTFNGSADANIVLSGGGVIPEGVLKFIGTLDQEGLKPVITGYIPAKGDVIVCIENCVFDEGPFAGTWKAGSEYLHNGESWIEIGPTSIDLDNYYTKDEADAKFATKEEIADFVDINEVQDAIDTSLEDYYDKSAADNRFIDTTELGQALSPINQDIEDIQNALDEIPNVYATKAELDEKADASDLTTLEGKVGDVETSVGALETSVESLETVVEAIPGTYATKEELAEHKVEADETYVAKRDHVTEPDINKMFPVDYEGNSSADFQAAVTALGEGGALNIDKEVVTPTTGNYGMLIGTNDSPVDIEFNLGENGSLVAEEGCRVFSVGPGSKVEIDGGEVTCTADEPAIFISNNASVTLDGVTLEGKNYSVLQSNGTNENSDFTIRNCTIYGPSYMPACGKLVIENSTLVASDNTAADAGPLYVKSGSITIRNSHFTADAVEHVGVSGPWKHNNNGWNGIATALVLENCNYGNHGNLTIDIDAASTFTPGYCDTTSEAGKQYDNVGILVINYNGNHADSCNIAQEFYEIDVTESAIAKHYFTTDGRGGTEQLTLRVPD